MRYAERFYRDFDPTDRWTSFRVRIETSDLYIRAGSDLSVPAREKLAELRQQIRDHIETQQSFLTSFEPVERISGRPEIIDRMYLASEETGTGPMASVAGAIAESVGRALAAESDEIIVENGGDIWLRLKEPAAVTIFTESLFFKSRVALKVGPTLSLGICTSSGKTGPSLSFGRADSVTVISDDAAFADAAATGTCNLVQDETSFGRALDYSFSMQKTRGVVIIHRDKMAVRGDVEITRPAGET